MSLTLLPTGMHHYHFFHIIKFSSVFSFNITFHLHDMKGGYKLARAYMPPPVVMALVVGDRFQ